MTVTFVHVKKRDQEQWGSSEDEKEHGQEMLERSMLNTIRYVCAYKVYSFSTNTLNWCFWLYKPWNNCDVKRNGGPLLVADTGVCLILSGKWVFNAADWMVTQELLGCIAVKDTEEEAIDHRYEEILLWESTSSTVICIFVTAHLCICVYTFSNQSCCFFLFVFLILTHRYLVLVVFARQHLHTSRFELSHLFNCRVMQEKSCIVQSSITTPTYILERPEYVNTFWQYITYVSKLAVLINCLGNSSSPANWSVFYLSFISTP